MPDVYQEFHEVMPSEKNSFHKIGKIILHYSDLTARLLQVVNSDYYCFSDPIEKISDAVETEQLSYLELFTVVTDKFKSIPESLLNMESFLKHHIVYRLIGGEQASCKSNLEPRINFLRKCSMI